MAELLDRIHAEIRERLAASRGAAQEYERLQAALAALGGPAQATSAPAPRRVRRPAAERAPRGANREAVLRALEERPGASASELAAASGVNRTVLYGVLKRLIEGGEVAKEELPGGSTGYKLLRAEPTAFPAEPEPEPAAAEEPPAAADAEPPGAAADAEPPSAAAPDADSPGIAPAAPPADAVGEADEDEPPLAAAA